jgi:hypothetical protein
MGDADPPERQNLEVCDRVSEYVDAKDIALVR